MIKYILATLVLITSIGCVANAGTKPIRLYADSIQFNQKKNLSIYNGNVRIKQGTLRIRARRADARGRKNKPEIINAYGRPLSIQHLINGQKLKLTATKAHYNIGKQIIDLSGSVTIKRNNETVHSNKVRYDLKQKIIVAGSSDKNSRVRAVIIPRKQNFTDHGHRTSVP